MVLFVIDAKSVAAIEFKGDAPRPVYMNRIADRLPMQTVKVKTELIHFLTRDAALSSVRRRKIRPCIFTSILEVLPSRQSSQGLCF